MINVVLVDDHNLVRAGIKHILAKAPDIKVSGEADNGDTALTLIKQLQPDIVLMDIKMPGLSGLLLLKKLLSIEPDLRVIIITACDNKIFPIRLLKGGAMGYFSKEMNGEELIRAIRMVHTGQRYIPHEIATYMALQRNTPIEKPIVDLLSDREYEILLLLTKGHTIQEISETLKLSHKTVNTYRYRVFDKLKVDNNVELTQFAIRNGLLNPKDNNFILPPASTDGHESV